MLSVYPPDASERKKALFGGITPSLENGKRRLEVAAAGLVKPIIGRFCGYFTSGRSRIEGNG